MTDDEVLQLIQAVGVNLDGLMLQIRKHLDGHNARLNQANLGEAIIQDGMKWLAKAVKGK